MTSIKAFIFDLDGVLTNTAEYHYQAWKRLAEEEGIEFDRRQNERLRGVSRRESLLLLLNGRFYPEEKLAEMLERKNNYYLEYIRHMTEADMLPGACSLLQELREAGIKIAIGSASKNAREVAERLGLFCFIEALSDGESVLQQKPAPDLFLHAAEQLGCLPKDCVVVEDSEVGVQAALAGGFWTVGLGPNKRVGAAHLVFPDLRGVKLGQILDALHQPKQC